jgi:hypothetical protein
VLQVLQVQVLVAGASPSSSETFPVPLGGLTGGTWWNWAIPSLTNELGDAQKYQLY